MLSLGLFSIVILIIPSLYVQGYIPRFGTWLFGFLPGKQVINEKMSLGFAYVLGAVTSGVLGNLGYDILKQMVRRRGKGST